MIATKKTVIFLGLFICLNSFALENNRATISNVKEAVGYLISQNDVLISMSKGLDKNVTKIKKEVDAVLNDNREVKQNAYLMPSPFDAKIKEFNQRNSTTAQRNVQPAPIVQKPTTTSTDEGGF